MFKSSAVLATLSVALSTYVPVCGAADFLTKSMYSKAITKAIQDKQVRAAASAVDEQRLAAARASSSNKVFTTSQSTLPRVENIPPVSVSKSLQHQTDSERSAIAQAIKLEMNRLTSELNDRLAQAERTPEVEAEIAALNDALSAKRQAYDLALGETTNVSNAAAEAFANTANPYFLICSDALWAPKDPVRWIDQIAPRKQQLITAGRSIGLITLNNEAKGTGFVVGKNHILTNLHVLELIARYDEKKRVWVVDSGAKISFDVEYPIGQENNCAEPNESRSYFVNAVFAVPQRDAQRDPDDLAVLLTSSNEHFPPPLKIVDKADEQYAGNMVVAVIGYPGPPRDMTVAETIEFFSTPQAKNAAVYPYKRLSGGFTGDRKVTANGRFVHKANTSRGNSGSPVFDLADGAVVGIHAAGVSRGSRFDDVFGYNEAITGRQVQKLLLKAGLGK